MAFVEGGFTGITPRLGKTDGVAFSGVINSRVNRVADIISRRIDCHRVSTIMVHY